MKSASFLLGTAFYIVAKVALVSLAVAEEKQADAPSSQSPGTNAPLATAGFTNATESAEAKQNFEELPSLFELTKKEALKGDAKAQADLGVKYLFGDGVPADANEAVKWFRKSVEQENASGFYWLGYAHYIGRGVPKSMEDARQLFLKAAEGGSIGGQYLLGMMCYKGEGAEKDLKEAVKWLEAAAEQENTMSHYQLGLMRYNGNGVEKDLKKAYDHFQFAAERGDAKANYWVWRMLSKGEGTDKDEAEAAKIFERSRANDLVGYQIGKMLFDGEDLPQDCDEAVKWIRNAAEKGFIAAQYKLGVIYYDSKCVPQPDYDEATRWFRKAAEQGDSQAQYALGKIYFKGQGVRQNYIEAYVWGSFAAMQGYRLGNQLRDTVAAVMTAEQIKEGKRRIDAILEAAKKRDAEKTQ